MDIPKLQIGTITAEVPIVQGGMGVKVSLSSLAAAVANEGGIGTIASVGLRTTREDYDGVSSEAIAEEIRKAQSATGGPIAVNVMSVLSNAETLIRTCVREGIKMIVVGAGLPLKLPAMVEDTRVNLVPIVSSGRAATLILRTWENAGGAAQAVSRGPPGAPLSEDELARQLRHAPRNSVVEDGPADPVATESRRRPGPQLGAATGDRFVCAANAACPVTVYSDASNDIAIRQQSIRRAVRNRFLERLDRGEPIPINCPYKCLSTCKIYDSRYCIAHALLNAYDGDMENGLVFAGQNVSRVHEILTVKELMSRLLDELRAA